MNINETISGIGVVPVIKLNHPERDAAPLAHALCAGGVPVAEVTFRAAGAAPPTSWGWRCSSSSPPSSPAGWRKSRP